jgi:hypothetical protein
MLEAFFYNDPLEADEIKDMLLRAACAEPEDSAMAPVVHALIQVFWELQEAEGVEEDEELIDGGREAEKLYQKVYCGVYRKVHARAVEASEFPLEVTETEDEDILEGAPWPETLGVYRNGGYVNVQYPKWLVTTMARAAAQRTAHEAIGLTEWHIKSGIPGTPQHRDFIRRIGAAEAAKHVVSISKWRAEHGHLTECDKCGSDVGKDGYCQDQTCPFSDWPQGVKVEDMETMTTAEVEAKYCCEKRKDKED